MLRSLSVITRAKPIQRPATLSFIALYSAVAGLARSKWRTGGPTPRSLAPDEQHSEVTTDDESVPGRAARMRSNATGTSTPRSALAHRAALKKSFPDGWAPPKRISREAMDGLRTLHAHDPETFSTPVLAAKFKISPEAVKKILKSKWRPSKERTAKLLEKERKRKEEWIAAQRAEEMQRQRELLRVRRDSADDKLSFT